MTDSKYIHLLSMTIIDWQELIGLIKSTCLDDVILGHLILHVTVWSRLLHSLFSQRDREVSKQSFKVWAPSLLFWLLPFSRSTWSVTKCPRGMFPLGTCFSGKHAFEEYNQAEQVLD